MRPRIGITTSNRPPEGVWQRAASVNLTYVRAVSAAGGVPVLLPNLPDDAEAMVAGLDGLLLSGGGDLDPAIWHELPHPACSRPDAERDPLSWKRHARH